MLIILVPQGDVRAQAQADLLTFLPRKVPTYTKVPVPETDTGGWVEYTKARERDLSKELGINSPVTSGEGVPVARRVSVKWDYRLFNKNTALC